MAASEILDQLLSLTCFFFFFLFFWREEGEVEIIDCPDVKTT